MKYNEETKAYICNDYLQTIGDKKKVLGVLVRGTDYLKMKPKGHPVQPEMDVMIQKVKEIMRDWNMQFIYLATEEKRIFDIFESEFPGKVLVNRRSYIDDEFYSNNMDYIGELKMGNDGILEYLSSMDILSKCDALVAGNCGGTKHAVLLNDMRYEYQYIFDLGVY